MKHTLLNKYIAGETTSDEEHKLMLLLQESPELTSEESAVLQLLQYSNSDADEEDIFAVDYSDEYNKVVRPRKIIRIWPLVAAACVAAILIVFLTPPKDEVSPAMSQTEIAKAEPQPEAIKEKENLPEVVPIETARTTPPNPRLIAKAEAAKDSKMAEVAKESNMAEETTHIPEETEAVVESSPQPQDYVYTVSNPERLEYTPEEMDALKRQAQRKYEEWMQLEKEIIQYEMKQTTALINKISKIK